MAARGNRGGVGERVLESKHVIGLFMLMLVFSGVFFALGYVMGRNQYDGQVRAATAPRATPDPLGAPRSEIAPKRSNSAAKSAAAPTSVPAEPSSDVSSQPDSDWGFYNAGKNPPDDTLKPGTATQPSTINAVSTAKTNSHPANVSAKSPNAQAAAAPGYTVQVAALRREVDAHSVALTLQKKKFPAFVVAPQSDKYFHVQVGPYPDQKSAEAAKKGLESAGFKAIVKH
jgi:septal ring-binding cell division protein DamX